ncbi:ABC transporter ATP-binding protein [Actomonas aquatica]|uniref:ABC transporter ATP-binding protein n=1 Tax=Actomonas aquatica TaxID=2866162 RepID=A0ABZ1C9W8_9BACT|nr:ABC transporter ATP-binding protein [Opitutus sp. WL0086]WRQ88483.1 ABC transporter ATP-binding protein [Opitutus sp. WL0086]
MSEAPLVIAAHGIGKAYRIWESPGARLSAAFWQGLDRRIPGQNGPLNRALAERARRGFRDFHALQDIELEVRRGESVGIIGRNGSGKSTLLQIIAGTLRPSTGDVAVQGRVAAQLELGAGFNPEFSGRENVYLYGAVLGLDRAAMDAKFDEVASFADIGEFLEEPVKTYSSGMMTRLAFAVSTCVEPEVLIIDEALSVGDAPFQAKCFRRLRKLIDEGVSLLFVSHDLATVRSVCSRALWLKDGRTAAWGDAKTVCREYEKFCWREQGINFDDDGPSGGSAKAQILAGAKSDGESTDEEPVGDAEEAAPALSPIDKLLDSAAADFAQRASEAGRVGTGVARFDSCVLTATNGELIQRVDFEQEAVFHTRITAREAIDSDIVIGLAIFNVKGERIAGVQNVHEELRLKLAAGESTYASVQMRFPFTHEKYAARLTLMGFQDGDRTVNGIYDFNRSIIFDQVTDALFFEVQLHAPFPIGPAVCLPAHITLSSTPPALS